MEYQVVFVHHTGHHAALVHREAVQLAALRQTDRAAGADRAGTRAAGRQVHDASAQDGRADESAAVELDRAVRDRGAEHRSIARDHRLAAGDQRAFHPAAVDVARAVFFLEANMKCSKSKRNDARYTCRNQNVTEARTSFDKGSCPLF